MATGKNINDSALQKITDFTNVLNRLYASATSSTKDGYIIIKELIDYIISQGGGGGDMTKAVYDTDNSGVVDDSELVNGDTVANDSAVILNTAKVSYDDSGNVVLKTTNQTIAGEKTFSDNLKVNAQAHGGSSVESFSASKTFDANDGNNQSMDVTASTTIGITNELPGTYVIELEIDTATPPTITIGASFGDVMDNSADLINVDNDINILTLYVNPSGAKRYTINTITA